MGWRRSTRVPGLKRRSLLISAAVLLGLFLYPQVMHAVSLLEVLEKARKHDPALQSAYFKQQGIQEHRKQAIAHLLPNVSGSGEVGHTFQDIISSDNSVFGVGKSDFGTSTYNLSLTQPLLHWDSIIGLKQANAEILRAEAEYQMAVQDLVIRVADSYLKVLAAQDQLTFSKAEQSAIEKHFELASGQFQKGLIPITDMHDAKARKATVSAQIIEVENILDDALQALQEITGEPVERIDALRPDIPLANPVPSDADTWIQAARKQNPAIVLQKHVVEIASKEVDRQNAGHLPTVDLVGNYSNEATQGSLFGGGSNIDTAKVLLKLNVPLYQGGAVSSKVAEAEHQLSAARQELIRQTRAIERQTRSAFLGVKTAINRVEALQQSVTSNQLAMEAKQEGFLSGLYTGMAVLDAERDLYLTRKDYAKARYEYLLNSLKLKKATDNLTAQELHNLAQLFQL